MGSDMVGKFSLVDRARNEAPIVSAEGQDPRPADQRDPSNSHGVIPMTKAQQRRLSDTRFLRQTFKDAWRQTLCPLTRCGGVWIRDLSARRGERRICAQAVRPAGCRHVEPGPHSSFSSERQTAPVLSKQLIALKVIAELNLVHEKCPLGQHSADGISVAIRYVIRRAEYTPSPARVLGRGRGLQEVDIQRVEREAKEDKLVRRFHV